MLRLDVPQYPDQCMSGVIAGPGGMIGNTLTPGELGWWASMAFRSAYRMDAADGQRAPGETANARSTTAASRGETNGRAACNGRISERASASRVTSSRPSG